MLNSVWLRGLRLKLLTLVMIPLVVIAAMSVFTIGNLKDAEKALQKTSQQDLPLSAASSDMVASMHAIMRYTWVALDSEVSSERQAAVSSIREYIDSYDQAEKKFSVTRKSESITAVYSKVPEAWRSAKTLIEKVLAELEVNRRENDLRAHDLIVKSLRPTLLIVERGNHDVAEQVANEAAKDSKLQAEAAERQAEIIIVCAAVTLIVMLGGGALLASKLARNITEITKKIKATGTNVAGAASQLSTSSQNLSSGVSEAAASLEETVAAVEELSSMVKRNADNAREAGVLSQSARNSAEEGDREIRELTEAMSDIAQSSKQIEDIINVIDDIAFQTNLLALNAAVEAARAGEQGKGFAVVADAVRNLAQRSASAAKDINNLIKDSVVKVERGSQIADKSGAVLKNIVTSVKRVADLNGDIAVASQEQANGISQIGQAMNQLDQATQSNAASAEQSAETSDRMSREALDLQTEVEKLSKIIEGSAQTLAEQPAERKSKPRVAKVIPFSKVTTPKSKPTPAAMAMPFENEEQANPISDVSNF